MFNWISENIGNIIAIVILAAVIAAIVIHLINCLLYTSDAADD